MQAFLLKEKNEKLLMFSLAISDKKVAATDRLEP